MVRLEAQGDIALRQCMQMGEDGLAEEAQRERDQGRAMKMASDSHPASATLDSIGVGARQGGRPPLLDRGVDATTCRIDPEGEGGYAKRVQSRDNARRGPLWARWLTLGLAVCVIALFPRGAAGCDLCAVYSATELRQSRAGLQIGVAEQFTRFEDLKDNGKSVPNPQNEFLNSSITQVLLGYNFDSRWGVQLNQPIISRTFRRGVDGGRERDDETGFGDLSLVGLLRPYSRVTENSVLTTTLFGGLKFPSGSADRLREERDEFDEGDDDHDDEEDEAASLDAVQERMVRQRDRHGDEETSGIHGHDLALGSGSVDGIIGGQLFFSWERFLWTTMVQYAMRTKGRFDYRYANDVQWRGGPGAFLLLDDDYSLTAQFIISGERKGKDEFDGASVGDTALTAVGLGPAFSFTWGTSLAADIAADIPVVRDNSGLQIVSEYRLRGGLTWRF